MTAKALVHVELEIEAGSSWGRDCSAGQVFDQAKQEVLNRLATIFAEAKFKATIVGKPTVTAVYQKEK